MAFTLWLSAEEERILERIMRHDGARTKEQAVIKAIRDRGAAIEAEEDQAGAAARMRSSRTADTSTGWV